MITRNGIAFSIASFGAFTSLNDASSANMKNSPETYVWLKNTNNKWACSSVSTGDSEEFDITKIGNLYLSSATLSPKAQYDTRYITQSNIDNDDEIAFARTQSAALILFLGDGTTPPTINDYKLEHCITEYIRKVESFSVDTKNLIANCSMIIVPNQQITINEIGCYRQSPVTNTPTYTNLRSAFLIDRKILKQPLVLEAGEQYTIDYQIDFRNLGEATM